MATPSGAIANELPAPSDSITDGAEEVSSAGEDSAGAEEVSAGAEDDSTEDSTEEVSSAEEVVSTAEEVELSSGGAVEEAGVESPPANLSEYHGKPVAKADKEASKPGLAKVV